MTRILALSLCFLAFVSSPSSCLAADRILFDRLGPTEATLFISNADGSAERPLTQPGSLDYNPSWSPEGRLDRVHIGACRIGRSVSAFIPTEQASNASPTTRHTTIRLLFLPMAPGLCSSPRAGGRANLWILDAASHKATPLTSGNGGDFRPSWSPDGAWIAFSSDRDSDLPPAKGRWERLHLVDIYLIHPDGTGLKRISQHGGFCGSPKWTPDSKA
jgi:TolB protein